MSRTFEPTRELAERKIRGEHLLIPISHSDEEMGALYNLPNEVASMIWEQAKAGASEDAIVAALLQAFEVDETTARQDVSDLLNELVNRNLLREVTPST